MDLDDFSQVAPSIFGYGIVAKGALKFLKDARIYDDSFTQPMRGPSGNWLLPSSYFSPEASNLELISPAINPRHFLSRSAKHLISELDFFWPRLGYSIWVSGTNGKSTTTAMIAHLLNIPAAGNIGVSLSQVLEKDLIVLEQSSFSLHYTRKASPQIYVLLDIAHDHLSWHESFEEYINAKLSPLARMNAGALAIVPAWLSGRFKTAARVVYYSDENDLARAFGFDIKRIYAYFKGFDALNASLAASVAMAVNASFNDLLFASFKPAAHRCCIFSVNEINFCDDSKATNAHAALACINQLNAQGFKRIHLLVGGDAKGQDLSSFLSSIKSDVKLYGIGATDIGNLLRRFDEQASWGSLKEQLKLAISRVQSGEIIALSPACASLDQYPSYAARGEEFTNLARSLCSC